MSQMSNRAVCSLPPAEKGHRIAQLRRDLTQHHAWVRELTDGYEIAFSTETRVIEMVDLYVTLEQACCSFLDFERRTDDVGRTVLRITGDTAAKRFMRESLLLGDGAALGDTAALADADAEKPRTGLIHTGLTLLAGGGVALLCCVTPVVVAPLAAVGLAGVWLDGVGAALAAAGAFVLAVGLWRRRAAGAKARSGPACGC